MTILDSWSLNSSDAVWVLWEKYKKEVINWEKIEWGHKTLICWTAVKRKKKTSHLYIFHIYPLISLNTNLQSYLYWYFIIVEFAMNLFKIQIWEITKLQIFCKSNKWYNQIPFAIWAFLFIKQFSPTITLTFLIVEIEWLKIFKNKNRKILTRILVARGVWQLGMNAHFSKNTTQT